MTSFNKVKDNAYGQLDAGIGTGDTSLVLGSGEGARFPLSADNNAILTIVNWDTSGTVPVVSKKERVTMTDRPADGDTLTVTRSYGGDAAQTFIATDYVYLNVTSGVIEQMQDAINALENGALQDDGSVVTDNNVAQGWRNQADDGDIDCFKLDAADILQILTLPRLPAARAIAHDNDVIDKKYVTDNFISPPAGGLMIWTTDTPPAGWLLCYGQAVNRTTYADLFAVIGVVYGVGDGSTTFNLPDLRGRLPLGQDDMGGAGANRVTHAQADILGGSEGAEDHTLVTGEMPAHTHTYPGDAATGTDGFQPAPRSGAVATSSSTGGGGAHENMPPYITLNYIIKT